MAIQQKEVKVSEVIALLKRGYTRYRRDDQGFGSIEQHYGLTITEARTLFRHPALKFCRTQFQTLRIIDDREQPGGAAPSHTRTVNPSSTGSAPTSLSSTTHPAGGSPTIISDVQHGVQTPPPRGMEKVLPAPERGSTTGTPSTHRDTVEQPVLKEEEVGNSILSRLRQNVKAQPISEVEKTKLEEPKAQAKEVKEEDSPFD